MRTTVDPIHRRFQIDELMDAAKLFASSNTCYYVATEMRLGNPNWDRTAPPACGVCPNCEKVNIFPRINKDGLKSALFDVFISGSNICTPQHVCECLRDYPDFGVNVLKAKANSKIKVSDIKKIIFQSPRTQNLALNFQMRPSGKRFILKAQVESRTFIFLVTGTWVQASISCKVAISRVLARRSPSAFGPSIASCQRGLSAEVADLWAAARAKVGSILIVKLNRSCKTSIEAKKRQESCSSMDSVRAANKSPHWSDESESKLR